MEAQPAKPQADGNFVTELEAQNAVRLLLRYMGEDPGREGLLETPERVVRAWDERTEGYGLTPESILSADFHGNGYDQMIVCRNIEFYSTCEHHLLPFSGLAHVGYIPKQRVVGLSKMARLVDLFAKRLQIQETLTKQVADAMQTTLCPVGVGVIIQARHLCMACRGVRKHQAEMVTTALLGRFRRPEVREEFLLHCAR